LLPKYINKFYYNFSTSCEASQIKDTRAVTPELNHKNLTLGIAAIIAAIAMTAVAYAVPQQALAHYGHHHHHNNNNGIKVDQQIGQANLCSNSAVCLNDANNTANIDR